MLVYIEIEKNKVNLTLKHLRTLKKKFDITIDWLINGVESISGIENSGKYKDSIRMMLQDMENDKIFMHGILSYYFEKRQQRKNTKGYDTRIPQFIV